MDHRSYSSCPQKVLFLYLLFIFVTSTLLLVSVVSSQHQNPKSYQLYSKRRMLLELEDEEAIIIKKKPTTTTKSVGTNKNQTKLIKPGGSTSSKNQTKISTSSIGATLKNQTKLLIKLPSDSLKNNKTKSAKTTTSDSSLKKLNSTSKSTSNPTNNKTSSISIPFNKKSSDLNKTTTKAQLEKPKSVKVQKKQPSSSWIDDDDDDDIMAGIRDLPSKFQETFVPDLEKISKTSHVYLTKYNKEFTKGFKPYVGNNYASTIASIVCFAFIIIPLILVSFIFNRIKAYFSLLKLLIFIQVYLAIYFTILCFSSLVTGLEPLKFFYSTSHSTYVCVQVLQTLGYVLYLLLLLMYLILVFSTETGLATKLLGLGQTFVGFAIGLHYYMMVFHRAVLHQPPKTSWKVHALYATCFLAICLLGKVDRRKKAYLVEGEEEGKNS